MSTTDLQIDRHKFLADGEAIPYYGNTVISIMNNENWPIYHLSRRMMKIIKESTLSDKIRLLPLESIHMTLIPLIREIDRGTDIWPQSLPTNASFKEIDKILRDKVEEVEPYHQIRMKINEVQITGFRLSAQTAAMNQELRNYRDQIALKTKIVHPGHNHYQFHVSLAYVIKPFSQNDHLMLDKLETEMTKVAKASLDSFVLAEPKFSIFNDMLSYHPELSERGNLF
ncbi:DUF1868 domain-containing protein [Ignavigranum ruoffiae]|uniref:DUF1868 domain-containing protein n=1 Tax=Ignavigranum ruoffiae TaxID=89093 RepID=UPI002069B42C|nr:DUF1868 domain-containing protein [Ignavigranum ruoffiae]UPQ86325.1 DUF1868 domain-containing protein [Ignavigranum ruoffiae]